MNFDWFLQQNGASGKRPFVRAACGFRFKNDPVIPTLYAQCVKEELPFQRFCELVWTEVVCAEGSDHRQRAHSFFHLGQKVAVGEPDAEPRPLLRLKKGKEHDSVPSSYTALKAPGLNIDEFDGEQILAVLAKPLRAYLSTKRKEFAKAGGEMPFLAGEKPPKRPKKAGSGTKSLTIQEWAQLAGLSS